MKLHPLTPEQLETFLQLAVPSEHVEDVRRYVENMLARDSMRLDWCFLVEDAGSLIGTVAFWKLPSQHVPASLVLLSLPWEREDVYTLGEQLFALLLPQMRSLGAKMIDLVIDEPACSPQWQYAPERRKELFQRLSFRLDRVTMRFERSAGALPLVPDRLVFRSLDEVGEAVFIDAIEQASAHTFDRYIQQERELLGAKEQARKFFEDMQSMEYKPQWWKVAYVPDGTLAGFVLPALAPAFGTIAYIGVLPAHRGQGYGYDLLVQGTQTLIDAGAHVLRADTDIKNEPMARTFRRVGYRQFAKRTEFSLKLASGK